jgi:long-chain acyl-CoA synthetase
VKKYLIDSGVTTKLDAVHATGEYTNIFYDKLIFSKVREGFGGNVRVLASGSAPLNP